MNKETFCAILECALLNFDGQTIDQLLEYGFNPSITKSGIKLCEYLKSIKIEVEIWK